MATNEVAQFTVVATVRCTTVDGTVIDNTAAVSSETPPDPDLANNTSLVTFTADDPVPVVNASVALAMLPQNNHDLVNIGLAATITDGACPAPTVAVVRAFSDEDDQEKSTHFSPDAKDIALATLRLRQERVGSNDGRVYLTIVSATDQAAAKAFADANGGTPPAGYFVVGDGPVVGPKQ